MLINRLLHTTKSHFKLGYDTYTFFQFILLAGFYFFFILTLPLFFLLTLSAHHFEYLPVLGIGWIILTGTAVFSIFKGNKIFSKWIGLIYYGLLSINLSYFDYTAFLCLTFLLLCPILAVLLTSTRFGAAYTAVITIIIASIQWPHKSIFLTNQQSPLDNIIHLLFLFLALFFLWIMAVALRKTIRLQDRRMHRLRSILHRRIEAISVHRQEEKRFYQIISHDLRSPVSKIRQFLGLYLYEHETFSEEAWPEILNDTYRSSESLSVLLDNLFHWFSARQGKDIFSCDDFKLEDLVREVTALYIPIARVKNIKIKIEIEENGPNLCADSYILSTILRNLLSNALKFTPKNGIVTLIGHYEANSVCITVKDQGNGITPQLWEQILQQEEQPASTLGTEKERGSGFGLKVCLLLAKKLKGSLEASFTSEDQGSIFCLRFPFHLTVSIKPD